MRFETGTEEMAYLRAFESGKERWSINWFTRRVLARRVSISLDAGFCVEALGEYEAVYLNVCASVPEARAGIGRYIGFYNAVRQHSAPGGRTPDQIYFAQPLLAAA